MITVTEAYIWLLGLPDKVFEYVCDDRKDYSPNINAALDIIEGLTDESERIAVAS